MNAVSKICLGCVVGLIIFVNIFRFYQLEQSPPGFHVDELSGAVTVQCLSEEGIDALDNPYPLFADLNYGSPKPPTYIYPAMIWTKLGGYSIVSFRAFSAAVTLIAIVGLFFLGRLMFHWQMGMWSALAASISPWWFQVSRIALEAPLAPCFLIWAIYFFFRSKKVYDAVIAGLLLSFAMYTYPPARLHLPLIFPFLIFLKMNSEYKSVRFIFITIFAWFISLGPLIYGIFSGAYMGRFDLIGISSPKYLSSVGKSNSLPDLIGIFASNFVKHLDASFLFQTGGDNLVYSTGRFGLFGWFDQLALIVGLGLLFQLFIKKKWNWNRDASVIVFFLWGALTAIIPSALTWQDIPHSLRMIGMWPFVALFSGYVIWRLCDHAWVFALIPLSVASVFCFFYFQHYFYIYPKEAHGMFSPIAKELALTAKTPEDWFRFMYLNKGQNFHLRYYVMNYKDTESCSSSQKLWKTVYKLK